MKAYIQHKDEFSEKIVLVALYNEGKIWSFPVLGAQDVASPMIGNAQSLPSVTWQLPG